MCKKAGGREGEELSGQRAWEQGDIGHGAAASQLTSDVLTPSTRRPSRRRCLYLASGRGAVASIPLRRRGRNCRAWVLQQPRARANKARATFSRHRGPPDDGAAHSATWLTLSASGVVRWCEKGGCERSSTMHSYRVNPPPRRQLHSPCARRLRASAVHVPRTPSEGLGPAPRCRGVSCPSLSALSDATVKVLSPHHNAHLHCSYTPGSRRFGRAQAAVSSKAVLINDLATHRASPASARAPRGLGRSSARQRRPI